MPKVFSCSDCGNNYQTGRGLRKHFQTHPSHRGEENVKSLPLQAAAAAANNFLDVTQHHRSARLKELLKLLTPDEFSTVVLCSIARHVSTSSFLLSRSKLTQGSVSESKLRFQCTPNDHHSSAPLYGQTFDANPSKVYIFLKLNNCRLRRYIHKHKKISGFPNIARYFSKYRGSLIKFVSDRI